MREQLAAHFRRRGQPAYRAQQTEAWIFAGDALEFGAMTDLPVAERDALAEGFCLREPSLDSVFESRDGTAKHLWRLACGEVIESVLIPTRDRLTLCVSSQAGCALACTFCATGWSGFGRQLSPGEIAGQYRASVRWARERGLGSVTNVVFMGMGEPLANRHNVFPALEILHAGYGVGARRITVSTVGVVPGIRALAARKEQFRLALSLHAPTSELRKQLVPLEKRYPLEQLICGRRTTILHGPLGERKPALKKRLRKWVPSVVSVYAKPDNHPTHVVQVQHRVAEVYELFYFFNTSAEPIQTLIELHRSSKVLHGLKSRLHAEAIVVEEWHLLTGTKVPVDFWHADRKLYMNCAFTPKQGRLFVVSENRK